LRVDIDVHPLSEAVVRNNLAEGWQNDLVINVARGNVTWQLSRLVRIAKIEQLRHILRPQFVQECCSLRLRDSHCFVN
jgi:hypothetical protein